MQAENRHAPFYGLFSFIITIILIIIIHLIDKILHINHFSSLKSIRYLGRWRIFPSSANPIVNDLLAF